jgi:hypothetical protein
MLVLARLALGDRLKADPEAVPDGQYRDKLETYSVWIV